MLLLSPCDYVILHVNQAVETDQLFKFKKAVFMKLIKNRQENHLYNPEACFRRQLYFNLFNKVLQSYNEGPLCPLLTS